MTTSAAGSAALDAPPGAAPPAFEGTPAIQPGRLLAQATALLFGSGFCALIYQIAWQREFRLIFGASTAASAAVLAIFMGGLGWGGLYFGRIADRHPRPLLLYAQLEGAVAVLAALSPGLLRLGRALYIAAGGTLSLGTAGATAARLAIAALVVLPATFAMGGTLPAASRVVESEGDLRRRRLALLYGVNTLGALTGSLLSTFVLLETLGTRETLWAACLVNGLVALFALRLGRALPSFDTLAEPALSPVEGQATQDERNSATPFALSSPQSGRIEGPATQDERNSATPFALSSPQRGRIEGRAWALAAAGGTGFVFFLMELVWFRLLAPLLGGTLYAFGMVLAAALLGIGIGGLLFSLWIAPRLRSPSVRGFALVCAFEALLLLLPYAIGDRLAVLPLLLRPLGLFGFGGRVAAWSVLCGAVVLPAAVAAGVQFPWLVNLLGQGKNEVGSDVGSAYAANTVGAVLGALAGGFGLVPLLTATGCWIFAGACLVLLALGSAAVAIRKEAGLATAGAAVAVALAALGLLACRGPTAVWTNSEFGAGRENIPADANGLRELEDEQRRRVVWEKEGVESHVALIDVNGYAFLQNGKGDGSAIFDASTFMMSGLLGALLHPSAQRALVIGLGTGETTGWLASVPGLARVDVDELEPAVREVAKACRGANLTALDNPKVHLQLGDARELVLTSKEKYDLVVSAPSNPYRAGVASLFSKEFYQSVKGILREDGIFIQWVQGYDVDSQTVKSVYATLGQEFSSVESWETNTIDLLLVASNRPHPYRLDELEKVTAAEPFRTALAQSWYVRGAAGLLSHYVANAAFAQALARGGEAQPNSDDRNRAEYGFARSMAGQPNGFSIAKLHELAEQQGQARPELDLSGGQLDWSAVADNRLILGSLLLQPLIDPPAGSPGSPDSKDELLARLELYRRFLANDSAGAFRQMRARPFQALSPFDDLLGAEVLAEAGDDSAPAFIDRNLAGRPVETNAVKAAYLFRRSQPHEAGLALEAAFVGYRQQPFAPPFLMTRTLELAVAVSHADRTATPGLLRALAEPFAAGALEELRRRILFTVFKDLGDLSQCQAVARLFEPYPPWAQDYLDWRRQCYQATHDPLAERAEADLKAFLAKSPEPISLR